MGGPDKDVEIEAAKRAIEDAGRDDAPEPLEPEQAAAAEAAEAGRGPKGDTPGASTVHEANAEGVDPDR